MFKAGSAMPDMYDLRWENMQAVRFGEKMSPAIFSALSGDTSGQRQRDNAFAWNGLSLASMSLTAMSPVDLTNLTFASGCDVLRTAYTTTRSPPARRSGTDISSAVKSVNVDLKLARQRQPAEADHIHA